MLYIRAAHRDANSEGSFMQIRQNRRQFLGSTSLTAAAGLLGARVSFADEGPPETTAIRLKKQMAICSLRST
jgi:nitrous oxide reductase